MRNEDIQSLFVRAIRATQCSWHGSWQITETSGQKRLNYGPRAGSPSAMWVIKERWICLMSRTITYMSFTTPGQILVRKLRIGITVPDLVSRPF